MFCILRDLAVMSLCGRYVASVNQAVEKWRSQKPSPSRIPEFYPIKKIHKPKSAGRPIISGCNGPTERVKSAKVTS